MNRTETPVAVAQMHADQFTPEFLAYLAENLHVYEAFEREALAIWRHGYTHYSARTIVEVLRHHSAIRQTDGPWKINDHQTPGYARLFALLNPAYAGLFEFRKTPATRRDMATTHIQTKAINHA